MLQIYMMKLIGRMNVKENIDKIFRKYKEYILYIFFGTATTLVNFVFFTLMINIIPVSLLLSNLVAFIGAVLFAYITNSRYVFKQNSTMSNKDQVEKLIKFFSSRIITFFVESILLFIIVEIGVPVLASKLFVSIIIVALNYILSKMWVFNK